MQKYSFECRISLDDVSFYFFVLAPAFVYDSILFVCVSERMNQETFLALHAQSAKKRPRHSAAVRKNVFYVVSQLLSDEVHVHRAYFREVE